MEPEATWDENKIIPPVSEKDPGLKKKFVVCLATKPLDILTALENQISDWSRMVRVFALIIKFKEILLSKINQHGIIRKVKRATLLNTSMLQEAKTMLMKMVQLQIFKGYPLYKTITSQIVSCEVQIKNFYFVEKSCSALKIFKFRIFSHPMIYRICDVMMSIST